MGLSTPHKNANNKSELNLNITKHCNSNCAYRQIAYYPHQIIQPFRCVIIPIFANTYTISCILLIKCYWIGFNYTLV